MKLKVRGFTKTTLKNYSDVASNPLVAISSINQGELGISPGEISVNETTAKLINGKSDDYVGLTKSLRKKLNIDNGQQVNVGYSNNELTIR